MKILAALQSALVEGTCGRTMSDVSEPDTSTDCGADVEMRSDACAQTHVTFAPGLDVVIGEGVVEKSAVEVASPTVGFTRDEKRASTNPR